MNPPLELGCSGQIAPPRALVTCVYRSGLAAVTMAVPRKEGGS